MIKQETKQESEKNKKGRNGNVLISRMVMGAPSVKSTEPALTVGEATEANGRNEGCVIMIA